MENVKKLVVVPEELVHQRLPPSETFHVHQPLFHKLLSLQSELEQLLDNSALPDDVKSKFVNDLQRKYHLFFRQLRYPSFDEVSARAPPPPPATPAPSATKEGIDDKAEVTRETEEQVGKQSWARMLHITLPKTYRSKGQVLLEQVKSLPHTSWDTNSGELIVNNVKIPGSNILELINYIARPARIDNPTPAGWSDFRNLLIQLNVTKDYFGNAKEWRNMMERIKTTRLSSKLKRLHKSQPHLVDIETRSRKTAAGTSKESRGAPSSNTDDITSPPFDEILHRWKSYE